ncbi:MAG: hypothetical protein MUO63_13140 [Desulfobulbaceae bacterium]|nr:hypothetical protein [Desulfobulbaceae bacterium]
MAGLILGGGNAFAESENILSGRAQNLPESRLLLADASLDLDITMEVVDEDVQSSKDITNIIELPISSPDREMERHQEQLGNRPEFSNGPGEGQGPGPNPFMEGNQESQQRINRPDDTGHTDSAGRPDSVSPGEMDNRDNATRGPADSGTKGDVQEMQNKESSKKGN